MSKNNYKTHKHQYTKVLKFAKNNIFLRYEEAMFVELVKACLTEKKFCFRKTEHSLLKKMYMLFFAQSSDVPQQQS